MRYLKIALGLALVAGLMAVVASPAMAVPRWVHCVKSETGTYSSGSCTTAGSGWATTEVIGTSEVTTSGELELEDSKATGGPTAIKCKGRDIGWVVNLKSTTEPGEDGTSSITKIECKFITVGSCEESKGVTAKPKNLPWGSKLVERGSEVRDELVSGTGGEPGWAVECTVGGILKITDECLRAGNTVNVIANRTTGQVENIFDERTKEETMAKCTVGGAEAGLVRGSIIALLKSGNAFWVLAPNLKT